MIKQGKNFEFHIYDREPAKKVGLDHSRTGHQFPPTRPEKGKDQTGKLLLHLGTCTREAMYQTRERARALMTRALLRKVREQERQDVRTWSTASIRGRQLSSSRLPWLMKTPRIFNLADDQSSATGGWNNRTMPPATGLWTLSDSAWHRKPLRTVRTSQKLPWWTRLISRPATCRRRIGKWETMEGNPGAKGPRCEDYDECSLWALPTLAHKGVGWRTETGNRSHWLNFGHENKTSSPMR